jgi:hypothetical protein
MSDKPKKLVTIFVNTRQHQVEKDKISFDEIIPLGFDTVPTGNDVQFLVTYQKGKGHAEGKLLPGKDVEVVDGMIFDVAATYKS